MSGIIITCNAGSSNTKLATFDVKTLERGDDATTYNLAETNAWFNSIRATEILAVGHRVVHGGTEFIQPQIITDDVVAKLKTYIPLAPLHQPAALDMIVEARRLYPDILHLACFDTAFHHTMPELERRFPLPRKFHEEGVMRYGFHGLSYQHIADVLPEIIGDKSKGRVIVVHLGGGASACAMNNLQSVATTMGFSTLDGMMMDTRSGAIDPGVILYLLAEKKMSVADISDLLYSESGLKGVSGISGDMQKLLESKTAAAHEAIELYCMLAAKQIAALVPALGGLDLLIFTGGIGQNALLIRERIIELLRWIGNFHVDVIPANEELVIAKACQRLVT
jgi:acetate kinase